MADYIPFSAPAFPTRPESFGTGLQMADADFMKQAAESQSLEKMFVDREQAKANLDLFRGQMPSKLAKSALEKLVAEGAMSIPGYAEALARGEMGAANKNRAAGDLAMGTLDSDIAAGRDKNETSMVEGKLKRYNSILGLIDSHFPAIQASSNYPGGAQYAYQQMLQSAPPEMRANMPQTWSPEAEKYMKSLREHLVNSVGHMQEMAKVKQQGKNALDVADRQGRWHVRQEQEKTKAKEKSAKDWLMSASTKPPEVALQVSYMIMGDPSYPEALRAQAKSIYDQAKKVVEAKLQSRTPPQIPGMPGPNPINLQPGGAPAGQSASGTIDFSALPK